MTEEEIVCQRASVIAEARTWLGTPYHPMAHIKGQGVDCAFLLSEVFIATGAVPRFTIENYNPQWHMHRDAERYVERILVYANEKEAPPLRTPLAGDIVVWRYGRTFSHGALVSSWPTIIHAHSRSHRVSEDNLDGAKYLTHIGENGPEKGKLRPMRVFSLKSWE